MSSVRQRTATEPQDRQDRHVASGSGADYQPRPLRRPAAQGEILAVARNVRARRIGGRRQPFERLAEAEIAKLPPDEAAVLRMRYGFGERALPMTEIAEVLGLLFIDALRLHAAALHRLRWLAWRGTSERERGAV